MKITEILVENQQVDEGPILNKIGAGIGKVAGTVAKGVGAVAGGVAGVGAALKKGYQAGKATVGAGGDEVDPAAAPAAGGGAAPAAGGFVKKAFNAGKNSVGGTAAPATTNAPAAAGGGAAAKTTPAAGGGAAPAGGGGAAPAGGGGAAYAQVKANIDKLDKKGKQRILATLQKEVGSTAAPATPAAGTAPAGAGAMANMAGQLATAGASKKPNTMANTPASTTNAAKPGNPNAAASATPAAGAPAKPGAAPAKPNLRMPMTLQRAAAAAEKPAAAPADDEQNYDTQTGIASPAEMQRNRAAGEKAAPYGFNNTTGKPNPKPAAEPGATTTTPSGEKVLANPVATVGTKRATNIGQATFDTQTGKALPGQAINAIRKKAEYGTGVLGAARKRNKAGAAAQESIDADRRNIMGTSKPAKVREKVSESFSLFRKR